MKRLLAFGIMAYMVTGLVTFLATADYFTDQTECQYALYGAQPVPVSNAAFASSLTAGTVWPLYWTLKLIQKTTGAPTFCQSLEKRAPYDVLPGEGR